MNLILEKVRCFADRHDIPIAPLTLLVGENSSGKTTVLAFLAAVSDARFPFSIEALHEAPYHMGAFETIVSSLEQRKDHKAEFVVGWQGALRQSREKAIATYVSDGGYPALTKLVVGDVQAHVHRRSPEEDVWDCEIRQSGSQIWHFEVRSGSATEAWFRLPVEGSGRRKEHQSELVAELLFWLFRRYGWPLSARSVAPLRNKPQRTYDVVRQEHDPEGRHLPHVLKSVLGGPMGSRPLEPFGKDSGLFDGVGIRQLGDGALDPVQILVHIGDQKINLADVGYGVSQVLPILVELVETPSHMMLLMQQPEVHLHPRAQAALGSLFAAAAAQRNAPLVIETHSDYIVDRVRMEIANGVIRPDQVALLWFHMRGSATAVHRIQLDQIGNVVDPPEGYREFFLREEFALVTRGSQR